MVKHVIYKGKCSSVKAYIGETARNLEVRVNEHSDVGVRASLAYQKTPYPQVYVGNFNHYPFTHASVKN